MEQHVDTPVPGGRGRLAGLQGSSPGQSSTAFVEQIGHIPGGGHQSFRPRQGSAASSSYSPAGSDDDADEPGIGVFRTFPRLKKVAKVTSHSSQRVLRSVSSSELSAHQMPRAGPAAHSRASDERTTFVDAHDHAWVRLDTVHGSYATLPVASALGGVAVEVLQIQFIDAVVLGQFQSNINNNNTIWGGSVLTGEEPQGDRCWVCRSCSSSVHSWMRQPSSHSCADCMDCCCHARRCATTAALVQKTENCAGPAVAVLSGGRCPCCAGSSRRPDLDKVVDMPVIVNDRVFYTVEVPQIQFIAC